MRHPAEKVRRFCVAGGHLSEEDPVVTRSYGLRERNRQNWRRISVPERGQDYNSLPRKYYRCAGAYREGREGGGQAQEGAGVNKNKK